jgi:uncharacterized protein
MLYFFFRLLTSLLFHLCEKKNMYFSKYNIMSQIRDSEEWFIMNLLTGNADLLDSRTAEAIRSGRYENEAELREKGYLTEPKEEERLYRRKYLDFLDERDSSEIQIFFVPTYACNFACSYCYQEGYGAPDGYVSEEVVSAFFRYVDTEFAGRKKYITLFGGEPLLPSVKARERVAFFLDEAARRGIDIAVVTNGYTLTGYLDILRRGRIREIQVTLDGVAEVHDSRRFLKGGGSTFERIVEGIDAALEGGFTVNLRMVLDRENMESLPELARYAIKKGWTANPRFKTQFGRNYELHTCQANRTRLFDRVEMYETIYQLTKKHTEILEFHCPAFSVSRFLADNGILPAPLFDACPGCKTEWAFDLSGRIYACTATVGKKGEELGTFYPEKAKQQEAVDEWEERDVTTIPECRECALQFTCGGGCAAVAKNRTGSLHSPDCRPVREQLAMGLNMYFTEKTYSPRSSKDNRQ